MIPLSECKHSYLYKVSAKDFSFGIFDGRSDGFIGVVTGKYSSFLKMEYHVNVGQKHGTVVPIKEVCYYPSDKIGMYMGINDVVTEEMLQENDDYKEFLCVGQVITYENEKMLNWLLEKEEQYCHLMN